MVGAAGRSGRRRRGGRRPAAGVGRRGGRALGARALGAGLVDQGGRAGRPVHRALRRDGAGHGLPEQRLPARGPRRRRARARRGATRRYKILEPGKTGLQAYGPLTECRILGEGWTSEEYPRGQPILWEKNKKKPLKVVAKNVMPCWEEAMNWMEIGRARRAARRATDAGPEAPRAPGPRGRSSARPSWATRRRRSPACRRTASSSSASRSPSARRRARSPPAAASSSAVP